MLDGKKFSGKYKGHNLYNTITNKSFDLSMYTEDQNKDQATLEGLEIIATMATLALRSGASVEEMQQKILECSRAKGSLGDTLASNISRYHEACCVENTSNPAQDNVP